MKLRPKSEIHLLVEQAFRMTWATNNILQNKFRGHIRETVANSFLFHYCLTHAVVISQMRPNGDARDFSMTPELTRLSRQFSIYYNEYVEGYLEIKKMALPAPLEFTKCELLAAEKIGRITDFICEIYKE